MARYGEKFKVFIDGLYLVRVTCMGAFGLRYLAFEVNDIDSEWRRFSKYKPESIGVRYGGKKGFFLQDPNGLPIEIRN